MDFICNEKDNEYQKIIIDDKRKPCVPLLNKIKWECVPLLLIGLIVAFIPGAMAAVSTPDRLGGRRSEIYNLQKVRVKKEEK
jgi:hypothetical protein